MAGVLVGSFLLILWYIDAVTRRQASCACREPAIAVLPFANQSDKPGQDYSADGLTQDIINALGRFAALTVMSWNAVLPFKAEGGKPGRSPTKALGHAPCRLAVR